MPINNSFKEQVRRNSVALISLVIAITGLGYNTWRNEQSEYNRTQRLVCLDVLMKLGELQQLVWHHHYDQDFEERGNLRTGWTMVLVIKDVSQLLDDPLPKSSEALWQTWEEHSKQLDSSRDAEKSIINAINVVRNDSLALLKELD